MARPLRIEFPGALYHVTSRGNNCQRIYLNERDRFAWLNLLGQVCKRFNFTVHAFCQMDNHFHVMIETSEGNLSRGMRLLNAGYSQQFNKRHDRVGHVLQGRYHAILVQKEDYLLELARYIVLNPVRAGLVDDPGQWPWSSYNYMFETVPLPAYLEVDWLLSQFASAKDEAMSAYANYVFNGIGKSSPLRETRHRLLLGDDNFVAQQRERFGISDFTEVAKKQRRAQVSTLAEYADTSSCREEAMAKAYHSTAYTMREIAKFFRVSAKTVSRAIVRRE